MTDVPEEVRALIEEREAARRRKDFAAADALRDRIREAGFEITDTAGGTEARPRQAVTGVSDQATGSDQVESVLAVPSSFDASVHWIVQGWPEDVLRGIRSFRRYQGPRAVQHVVVEAAGLLDLQWPDDAEVVHVAPEAGWAAGRNAGLRRAAGHVVVVADASIEAAGDVLGPLVAALEEPTVGIAGPFGVVTDDLREFRDWPGPDVDAVEGYLMAVRRELVETDLRFDEKFRFYRAADIEFSFQVKARGLRAVRVDVPVIRHEHRMWSATPEEERARLSRRNFYRFLDRWRGREDLLVGRGGGSP